MKGVCAYSPRNVIIITAAQMQLCSRMTSCWLHAIPSLCLVALAGYLAAISLHMIYTEHYYYYYYYYRSANPKPEAKGHTRSAYQVHSACI